MLDVLRQRCRCDDFRDRAWHCPHRVDSAPHATTSQKAAARQIQLWTKPDDNLAHRRIYGCKLRRDFGHQMARDREVCSRCQVLGQSTRPDTVTGRCAHLGCNLCSVRMFSAKLHSSTRAYGGSIGGWYSHRLGWNVHNVRRDALWQRRAETRTSTWLGRRWGVPSLPMRHCILQSQPIPSNPATSSYPHSHAHTHPYPHTHAHPIPSKQSNPVQGCPI